MSIHFNDALYKTSICKGWQEGNCRFGRTKCKFAHGPNDLRQRASHSRSRSPRGPDQIHNDKYKTEICRHFRDKGYCTEGERCNFAHGPDDLQMRLDKVPNLPSKPPIHSVPIRVPIRNSRNTHEEDEDLGADIDLKAPGYVPENTRVNQNPRKFHEEGEELGADIDLEAPGNTRVEPQYVCPPVINNQASHPDPRKYKTQLCRNFMAGLGAGACTRVNCWFAHGEDELRDPDDWVAPTIASGETLATSKISVNTDEPYFQTRRTHERLHDADKEVVTRRDVQRAKKYAMKNNAFHPTHHDRYYVEVPHKAENPNVYAMKYVFLEDLKTVINAYPRLSDPVVTLGAYMVRVGAALVSGI